MSDRPVRVRIGPSPTGEPHVGTAYIALFNLAFARRHGGKFVLRIEDTDQERSKPEWEQQIMEGLRWLGLQWDEGPDVGGPFGPYRQSERREIHARHAHLLVERGEAYRCFCTRERLEALRAEQKAAKVNLGYDRHCRELAAEAIQAELAAGKEYVIRMKMPTSGVTVVPDRLRGDVAFENAGVDDQILLKADGFPTYHLANVVDDHLMEISHVIRAEEWINSTPKHLVLYRAFGWEPPVFVHMPLLRNADKSKISKRKNPVSILDYKQRGYTPPAVLNYLAMLGWTMPDGRELFGFDEFVQEFDLDRIVLGGPTFDLDKLTWLNGKYYREKLTDADLVDQLLSGPFAREQLLRIVPLIRERVDKAEDFIPMTDYFFRGDVELPLEELKPKKRSFKEVADVLEELVDPLEKQVDFSAAALEAVCRAFAEARGWSTKDLFMPLRIAVTGRKASPPLFDTMSVLGRALVRRRLRTAVERARSAAADEARKAQAEAAETKKKEAAQG
jgi:glutamyl-tRNA synthetase